MGSSSFFSAGPKQIPGTLFVLPLQSFLLLISVELTWWNHTWPSFSVTQIILKFFYWVKVLWLGHKNLGNFAEFTTIGSSTQTAGLDFEFGCPILGPTNSSFTILVNSSIFPWKDIKSTSFNKQCFFFNILSQNYPNNSTHSSDSSPNIFPKLPPERPSDDSVVRTLHVPPGWPRAGLPASAPGSRHQKSVKPSVKNVIFVMIKHGNFFKWILVSIHQFIHSWKKNTRSQLGHTQARCVHYWAHQGSASSSLAQSSCKPQGACGRMPRLSCRLSDDPEWLFLQVVQSVVKRSVSCSYASCVCIEEPTCPLTKLL